MKPSCVLLIDDDKVVNASNKNALELEGYEVYTARTMQSGRRLCAEKKPDLILLDILLPDANALNCGRELKEEYGSSILYLSCLDTKNDVIQGLKSGGDDYLTKPYVMEELLLRVQSLLRRRERKDLEDDFYTGRLRWHTAAKRVDLDGEEVQLQPREYAVLEYLQRNSERYVPVQELAQKIWLTENKNAVIYSIRNTVHGLRSKLKESGCAVTLRRGEGYRFVVE